MLLLFATLAASAGTFDAATAVNALGIDLLHQANQPSQNTLLSPYSIQNALAMTYAGADGVTREQMMRTLHYSGDDSDVSGSFSNLRQSLERLVQQSADNAEQVKKWGEGKDPITLTVANRLFGQTGYEFRQVFLDTVSNRYDAPFEAMDFRSDAAGATKRINGWVEEQTRDRIRDLIPNGALTDLTRLVLVNAVYLKAPWLTLFETNETKPRAFYVAGGKAAEVPTMMGKLHVGYAKRKGFTAVTLAYDGGELQFLMLLPDATNGLAALEGKLTPELLADCAKLPAQEIKLYLPKFKLEPPGLALGKQLAALGMPSAFDSPPRSANFDRMAPRQGDNYLFISEVFHKTFLSLDEKGTEAAAATAVVMAIKSAMPRPKPEPIEVHVDHPFVFAIQHKASGACLFLGHLTDPR